MLQPGFIEGGLADPVFDAQRVFRAVMEAMARPGTVHGLVAVPRPPAPLSPAAAAVALTLCDHDTPLWLDPALSASEAVKSWLGFHTGAPPAPAPAEAHFALVAGPGSLMALCNFAQGRQDYPDRSTTLILQVDDFAGGETLVLAGPGIETETRIAPAPMPRHFKEQWAQNNASFPRGVDLVLAGPQVLVCLPRTTRIRNGDH